MCLVFLVAAGIIAAIAMKLLNLNDDVAKLPGPDNVRICFASVYTPVRLHHVLMFGELCRHP